MENTFITVAVKAYIMIKIFKRKKSVYPNSTEQVIVSDYIPGLFWGDFWFQNLPGHRLSSLRFFILLLRPS
jgi:hypothetical protein